MLSCVVTPLAVGAVTWLHLKGSLLISRQMGDVLAFSMLCCKYWFVRQLIKSGIVRTGGKHLIFSF